MHKSRDRRKYLSLLWEVSKRLEVLHAFIDKKIDNIYLQVSVESEALQIRKILELIAYASLISHKEAYEEARNNFSRDWHAKRIIKQLESINPNFYPIPIKDVERGGRLTPRGGYLTKLQFENLYDRCGSILHSKNPFLKVSQRSISFHNKVPEYVDRIENLLTKHSIGNQWGQTRLILSTAKELVLDPNFFPKLTVTS